jgi:hypothetical protein
VADTSSSVPTSLIYITSSSTSTTVVPVTLTRPAPSPIISSSTLTTVVPVTITQPVSTSEAPRFVVVSSTVTVPSGQSILGSTITVVPTLSSIHATTITSSSSSAPSTTVQPMITEVVVSSISTLQTVVLLSSTVILTSGAKKVTGYTTIIPAPPSALTSTLPGDVTTTPGSSQTVLFVVVPTFTLFNPGAVVEKTSVAAPVTSVVSGVTSVIGGVTSIVSGVTNIISTGGALAPIETLTSTLDAGLPTPTQTQVLGNTSVVNAPAKPTPPTAGALKNAGVGGMGLVGGVLALGVWAL